MGDDEKDSLAYTYTQETTLHGIGRAANKEKSILKRGLWVLFFLGCLALFMYFLCDSLIRFFDYPVSTKLTYNTETNLDFPSVTICNYNQITASYLAEKNDRLLNETVEYFDGMGNAMEPSEELTEYMKTVDMEKLYEEGAQPFDSLFLSCTFVGVALQEPIRPGACNFPQEVMVKTRTSMGICYTFHPWSFVQSNGTLKSRRAGNSGGLSVVMNVAQDQYRMAGFSGGVKVLVHDPQKRPNVFELGSGLEPGTDVFLAMKKVEMLNLPHPYARKEDSCVDLEAEDYVNPLKYNERYSHAACTEENLVRAMLNFCGCVDYLYNTVGERICNAYEYNVCLSPVIMNYYLNETVQHCPKPCHEIKYEVSVSQSYYPNLNKMDGMARTFGIPTGYFERNIISLNVYFGELEFTKIEQEAAFPFSTAIAGIGGFMGLCLGASILTVFEIVELGWDFCARAHNKRMKSGSKNKVDNQATDHTKKSDAWSTAERKPTDYPQFQDYAT